MDNTNTNSSSSRGRSSGGSGVSGAASTAINRESDVKKDMGPSVSNTYVADTMTVTNNYNF